MKRTQPRDTAFPYPHHTGGRGLSKREYFAVMAMRGIYSVTGIDEWTTAEIATHAVRQADALIDALNTLEDAHVEEELPY